MGDRWSAVTTEATTLEFQFLKNQQAYDALSVRQVTIHASYDDAVNNTGIIQTITAAEITKIDTGRYQYVVNVISTEGSYFDKIFLTPSAANPSEMSFINTWDITEYVGQTDVQISDAYIQQIKKVLAYPSADNLLLTDAQIKTLIVKPELDRFFIKFPIKVTQEYFLSPNAETSIAFPDVLTFGVTDVRVVGKDKINATGTGFWDLVAFNQIGLNTRYSGMYGVKGYNPSFLRQMNIQKRFEIATQTNLGTVSSRMDFPNRTMYVYSNLPGRINITWAKYSNNFEDVCLERKWDVITLAQAGLLDHMADTAGMVENGSEVNIASSDLRARASELRASIIDVWKEIPDPIVLRMSSQV